MKVSPLLFLLISLCFACQPTESPKEQPSPIENWAFSDFVKIDSVNPCLLPSASPTFFCPIREETVQWEEKDVFNPTAVVRDGKIMLIYRAEDTVGKFAGTSRLGLATSTDGFHFTKMPNPIFYPDNDAMKTYEWEGGVEDPRIIETEDGRYFMTYTAWDGKTARLCIASSIDLLTWKKHGLVLGSTYDGKYKDTWSKSGAIVARQEGNKLIAHKINGKYWMYWGDTDIFICSSDDMINWSPLIDEKGQFIPLMQPRPGHFDTRLIEPGPSPVLTDKGIVFIYNSRNDGVNGDTNLEDNAYAAGQALIDPKDPTKILDRSASYFMKPDKDYEIEGQVNKVCFLEGLVPYKGQWFLYYGTADSKIAVAVSDGFQ